MNTATEEINKLEIELEVILWNDVCVEKKINRFALTIQEADSTFHILLNESTRRLKLLTKKLGSCIEKSAPYYESLEKARLAQIECQVVAAKFQRANGWSDSLWNYIFAHTFRSRVHSCKYTQVQSFRVIQFLHI